jgi:hypothetical protein
MAETIEQKTERLNCMLGTLRARLATCRRKREEAEQRHKDTAERLRQERNGYKRERDEARSRLAMLAEDGSDGRYSGCYLLLKLGVVVYIGQSINVFGRVAYHRGAESYPTCSDFDELRVIWCGVDELLKAIPEASGTRTDLEPRIGADTRLTRQQAATDAGMSKRQKDTALQVAAVPADVREAPK